MRQDCNINALIYMWCPLVGLENIKNKSVGMNKEDMPEGLSTLFIRRRGRMLYFKALASTNLVCASGPSPASTTKIAPSTMPTTRSTYVTPKKKKRKI